VGKKERLKTSLINVQKAPPDHQKRAEIREKREKREGKSRHAIQYKKKKNNTQRKRGGRKRGIASGLIKRALGKKKKRSKGGWGEGRGTTEFAW